MKEQESRAKKIINDLSKKIDELMEQSDISKEDVKKEVDKRVEELKRSRDQVNEELKKIKEDNKETVEKVEKFAKNTANEIKSAFSGFMDKMGQTKKESPKKGNDPQ